MASVIGTRSTRARSQASSTLASPQVMKPYRMGLSRRGVGSACSARSLQAAASPPATLYCRGPGKPTSPITHGGADLTGRQGSCYPDHSRQCNRGKCKRCQQTVPRWHRAAKSCSASQSPMRPSNVRVLEQRLPMNNSWPGEQVSCPRPGCADGVNGLPAMLQLRTYQKPPSSPADYRPSTSKCPRVRSRRWRRATRST